MRQLVATHNERLAVVAHRCLPRREYPAKTDIKAMAMTLRMVGRRY